MSVNPRLCTLAFLAGVVSTMPVQSQDIQKLVGLWKATVPAADVGLMVKDGDTIRFKGRPAYTITLEFKLKDGGSIQWGNSAKVQHFVYRLMSFKLIEVQYPGKKPWRHTLTISDNKLYLGQYPISKKPQESIDVLHTLTFVKQL